MVALASVIKNVDVRILDVGAGAGNFVRRLKVIGIKNSIGIDPYIKDDLMEKDDILVKILIKNLM